jgi:hypothetical protein
MQHGGPKTPEALTTLDKILPTMGSGCLRIKTGRLALTPQTTYQNGNEKLTVRSRNLPTSPNVKYLTVVPSSPQ